MLVPRLVSRICCMLVMAMPCILPAVAQPKYNLKHYTTEDGLLHDRISCILKDKEGFMWFGTWDGLNRFDGHTFVAYKGMPGDNSNLENNKIRLISEDRWGYLWIKTFDNKIYLFNKKTEKFLAIQGLQAPQFVKNIVVDRIVPVANGDTWLLSASHGALCAYGDSTRQDLPVIKAFGKSEKGSFHLNNDQINFLFEDSRKQIWLGTSAGIYCLKKTSTGNYDQVKLPGLYADQSFTCITQHGDDIYLGTAQGKLFSYSLRSKNINTVNLVPGTAINAVYYAKNHSLYFTTAGKGLIEYNPAKHQLSFRVREYKELNKIYEDKYGLLWIQPERGILKYDPANATYKLFTQKKDAEAKTIHTTYQAFEDAYHVLWVCMVEGGFGYYNRAADKVEYFHNEPGSPDQKFSNVVTVIYADPAGVLWFSGYDRGINKVILQPDVFKQYLIDPASVTKTTNEVRALCEDHNGRLWVGNKAGHIYLYKNGIRLSDPLVNLPPRHQLKAYCIYESKDKTIWLGTKGQGLIQARPLKNDSAHYQITTYVNDAKDINSISNNNIYSIFEDHKGRLWLGTFGGGLNRIVRNGSKITFKSPKNAFKHYELARANGIRHLQEDPKGNIWIASTNGLVIFNPDQGIGNFNFKRYTKQPGDAASLGNNDVQYICRDASDTMWLGTFGGGLQKAITNFNLQDKVSFKVYTTANGLPNDIILSIISDRRGHLWLATENGLSEFNPVTQVFKNYNTDDGLPQTPFSESAAVRSASGNLYIGCGDGFIAFDPQHVASSANTANIALTDFQIANKSIVPANPGSPLKYAIDHTNEVELKYDQNLFSINYTVLDYKITHKIWYAYKLEGFDKQWNQVRNLRQAVYTNVPPGNYTFRVKSVSSYLFKNTPERSVSVTILPPFWKTYWAYLIYFILAAIAIEIARRIIFTMIRLRNRVTVEQKLAELKLQFFTNISHELRTPLTLIVNPLEQVLNHEHLSKKGREHVSLANKNANRMVRFINQLLDFRKLQSGSARLQVAEVDVIALIKQTLNYFTELAHERQISLTFQHDNPVLMAWLDAEKIDIVVYNLLANAFKFSPAGKNITVVIEQREDISIKVIDEGPGVPEDKLEQIFKLYYEGASNQPNQPKGTGIGLAFSKELISSHHGSIRAANNPAGGMTFTICLKPGKEHFDQKKVDFVKSGHMVEVNNLPVAVLNDTDKDINPVTAVEGMPLVLIVEDNNELRKFLGDQLSAHYRVEMAEDGAIGLQKATDLVPDLIISDVMMPNMDGIAMLDAIKNQLATSHIPVVLLTARSSVEHQIEGIKYGADFYVTKPFNTGHVITLVDSLIRQRRKLFNSFIGNKNVVQLAPGEILITSKDEQLLKQVIEIVEQHMADVQFNIDEVATAVGLGRTTFYKKLKSLTGMAPVEFVKEMRLKRSLQLMDSGEFNISEISYRVGFTSLAYFSTCFKEKYQQTPSQYLKQLKEKQV
jgi:signal transduction histidine kinase/ligand-binding sensor domain-containing protein/DNA-binding response OmpR family regulator